MINKNRLLKNTVHFLLTGAYQNIIAVAVAIPLRCIDCAHDN